MVGSLTASVESLPRIKGQQPRRFTNPCLSLKCITFLRSFAHVNSQAKERSEHLIWLFKRISKIVHGGSTGGRMSDGRKSLRFSPQNSSWKGHSSALAMPAPARESPPSHLGEVLARNDLLQMLPRLSIWRLVWDACPRRKQVWGKSKHLRTTQEGFLTAPRLEIFSKKICKMPN